MPRGPQRQPIDPNLPPDTPLEPGSGAPRIKPGSAAARIAASEAALANATDAMRIHGAYGYSKELNIERYYRDAPLLCIGEGTNELQMIIIAKQLVERNPI